MQANKKTDSRRFKRRLQKTAWASAPLFVTALASTPAAAAEGSSASQLQQPQPQQQTYAQPTGPAQPSSREFRHGEVREREQTYYSQFDDSFDLYVAPGVLNVPYGGEDEIDYRDAFDPGYQWGLGLGWFARTESAFAIGVGAYFDHSIINADGRGFEAENWESVFRTGLELKPGFVLAERAFLYVPLRGGYAADVLSVENDTDIDHGPHFGVGGGLDLAIYRGLYLGTVVGTDLQFFRSGTDFNAYLFTWRAHVGYRF